MIYEMRTYEAMPGKMADLHKLIGEVAFKAHQRHGMKVIGYWTTVIGPNSNKIMHMLSYDSLAAREKAWEAFQADEDWRKGLAGNSTPLVASISSEILRPTPYSPMQECQSPLPQWETCPAAARRVEPVLSEAGAESKE